MNITFVYLNYHSNNEASYRDGASRRNNGASLSEQIALRQLQMQKLQNATAGLSAPWQRKALPSPANSTCHEACAQAPATNNAAAIVLK